MPKSQPAIVKSPPDYRYLGFVLSPQDARQVLELKRVADVYDLVRTGALAALSTSENGQKVLLFHPDELIAYRAAEIAQSKRTDGRLLERATAVVRAYLRENDPVDDYDEAVELSAPVWGKTKTGRAALHVNPKTIARRFNACDEVLLQQEAPVTTGMIEAALRRIGGQRVKGFIAVADQQKVQRWSWWYRLPHDIAFEDEVPDVAPLVRDKGESVLSRGTVVHIDTPLTSRRNDG